VIRISSGRDSCVLRCGKMEEDGTYVSVSTSINDKRLGETPGYVRAAVSVAGWIIRPADEGKKCDCIRIAQIDPKGWIPPWITNLFKRKAAEGIVEIQKLIESGIIT